MYYLGANVLSQRILKTLCLVKIFTQYQTIFSFYYAHLCYLSLNEENIREIGARYPVWKDLSRFYQVVTPDSPPLPRRSATGVSVTSPRRFWPVSK